MNNNIEEVKPLYLSNNEREELLFIVNKEIKMISKKKHDRFVALRLVKLQYLKERLERKENE